MLDENEINIYETSVSTYHNYQNKIVNTYHYQKNKTVKFLEGRSGIYFKQLDKKWEPINYDANVKDNNHET